VPGTPTMPGTFYPPSRPGSHARLIAGHFGATLGASHLIARLSRLVRHFVTATGAHAVTAWPGRLGSPHATRPATATASSTAAAS
jgi:hypothetical protein